MSLKYACLVFDLPIPFPYFTGKFSFDAETDLFEGSVKDSIEGSGSDHWKEWVGSIAWDILSRNSKLILTTWKQSDRPDVLDIENEALTNKLLTLFRIIPLVGPLSPPPEDVFVFSGQATRSESRIQFKDIRTFARVDIWRQSYFSENYWDEFYLWAQKEVTLPKFLDEWKTCYQRFKDLFQIKKANTQLFEAYGSFEEAFRTRRLESKIPALFRSIECIVECWGRRQFAERVPHLIGTPTVEHPYGIWQNTADLLVDLYELRNDCCHGKPFAFSLYKKLKGPAPGSLIAKYEFLAEWAARKVILDSFNNVTVLAHTNKYEDLVDAWEKGLIKP